jgi:hypothetical protein
MLRSAEKVVIHASKIALENIWYIIGPHQERLCGDKCHSSHARSSSPIIVKQKRMGERSTNNTSALSFMSTINGISMKKSNATSYGSSISLRQKTQLRIAILHCTPSPLTGFSSFHGDKSVYIPSRAHPMEQYFYKQLLSVDNEESSNDQFIFKDYCCYANQFPTFSERRKAYAYLVIGDVCDVDTVLSENRGLILFLSKHVITNTIVE